jgi:hypothetical protein
MTTTPDTAPNAGPLPAVGQLPRGRRAVLSVALGVLLALAAAAASRWLPRGWLLVVLVPAQLLLALGWLALTGVPGRLAGIAVAWTAGVVGDVILTVRQGSVLGALAGVIGVAVVATVLGQIVRRERTQVTDVLAAQCSAVVLTVAAAVLAGVRGAPSGREAAATGLLALAVALAAGGLVDVLSVRVWVGPTYAGRSLVGALLAIGVGAGAGAALHARDGLVLGVVAAALGVLADAVVAIVASGRRLSRLLGAVLPLGAVGPGLYVVTRVLFG